MAMVQDRKGTHPVVSREEWLAARKPLLAREKAATRERDEIARLRRELPWVRVEEEYVFDDAAGKVKLADLFDGRSQLVVYHFMFDPAWSQGCKSCSLVADHYNPAVIHLAHRDVTMVTVSLTAAGYLRIAMMAIATGALLVLAVTRIHSYSKSRVAL